MSRIAASLKTQLGVLRLVGDALGNAALAQWEGARVPIEGIGGLRP